MKHFEELEGIRYIWSSWEKNERFKRVQGYLWYIKEVMGKYDIKQVFKGIYDINL